MRNYFIIILSIVIIFFYFLSKKSKVGKAGLTYTVFIAYTIYIILRLFSIPFQYGVASATFGILLLLAEILGYFAFITYIYIFYTHKPVKIIPIKKNEENLPTVDVLICTYNEPIDIVFVTIAGAMMLDYPKELLNVYVLDDGHRDEFKKLAEELNVHYITREKNEFAKAGNINNALKYIKGDLFLVLDADMIPKRDYLQKTVGQFKDPNLAFVQLPQTYYNEDVYQYNTNEKYFNEQDFFMRCIEPARNSKGAVLHVGTNALFRRKHVESVGGYPTSSITEDMALGLLLQAKGYNSTFINEPLVVGLSALNLKDLVKQRDRWCRGNLQVLKHFKKTIKSLKFGQKMIYIDGVLYWFTGISKMIFLSMPIIHLLTGIPIVNYDKIFLIPLFFVSFIGQILLSKRILRRQLPKGYLDFFFTGNIYTTVMAPHLTFSVLKHYFAGDHKFTVTNKKSSEKKGSFSFKYVWCSLLIFILSLVSVAIGAINVFAINFPLESLIINSFWILYNIPGLLTAIQIGYQKPRENMFPLDENIQIRFYINSNEVVGTIKAISLKKIKLEFPKEIINKIKPNDKFEFVIGKTRINAQFSGIKNQTNLILKLPDNLNMRIKIFITRAIIKFLKPYKDNYNYSLD